MRRSAYDHAASAYASQPVSIPVHLFVAEDEARAQGDTERRLTPALGWDAVVPRDLIRRIDVPGTHLTMMEQHNVGALGDALTRAIDSRDLPKRNEDDYVAHVLIQSGHRDVAPVFCIPGAGNSAVTFAHLASAMPSQWPIHGLQARGLDGRQLPHTTIEAAASAYIQLIEDMYPHGPIHLIGHSFGGWIAFDIAIQLSERARAIASLTLLDSEPPDGAGIIGKEYSATDIAMEYVRACELSAGRSLGISRECLELLRPDQLLSTLHEAVVAAGLLPRAAGVNAIRGPLRVFGTALRTTYAPTRPFAGQTRLVLATNVSSDAPGESSDLVRVEARWRSWAPSLRVWHAPGNHMTILQSPQVTRLTEWWTHSLQEGEGQDVAIASDFGK